MPGLFIFSIILGVIALACIVIGGFCWLAGSGSDGNEDVLSGGIFATAVGVFLGIGTVVCVLASSFNSVGTYDIGVTTSFGRVLSYVGPGAHWIAPWENMSLMDESVQTIDDSLTVRVAGQQTAQAEVKLRVQLQPKATDSLFKQYKGNTANVMSALVKPELNVAMNSVYDGYDPILPLSTNARPGTPDNPTTAQLSSQVKSQLIAAIGTQVKVDTLIVEPLQYDQTVTDRINQVLSQTAQTDKAREAVNTAQQQAKANQVLQASLSSNPLVLVNKCLDEISDGQLNPPAGFSCWPGQGSGVVIPSGK